VRRVVTQPFALGSTIADLFDDMALRERVRLARVARQARREAVELGPAITSVFEQTKNELDRIARTSVTHVSNASREQVLSANDNVIQALRWNSVLDSRTSDVCRARDGKMVAIGNNVLPDDAPTLDPPGARPPAHPNCRSVMTVIYVGEPIPKDPTYGQWLKSQPAAVQDDILGATRGRLFRDGGLTLDSFVSESGRRLNLRELQQREPFAFDRANVRA